LNDLEESGKKRWLEASSFEDIGELTALWIEGKISYHPFQCGGIDSETIPLAKTLAEFNRKGYITAFSQPAEPLTADGYGQRAAVDGYAQEELAKKLAALTLYTELLVIALPPRVEWGYAVPITLDEFHPHTWTGHSSGTHEIEFLLDEGIILGASTLINAWQVCIIDLQWGRKDYLWDKVLKVINNDDDRLNQYDVTPLDLEVDFYY
jgi:hypothetical protein